MADTIPLEGLQNLLSLVVGSAFPIKCRLFKNNLTVTLATVLADLTEADFSGYAPQNVAPLDPPVEADEGIVRSQVVSVTFAHDGGAVANTVHGYYVTIELPGGTALLWVGQDDNFPFTYSDVTHMQVVDVEVLETQEV
jgi:hypothetical protein